MKELGTGLLAIAATLTCYGMVALAVWKLAVENVGGWEAAAATLVGLLGLIGSVMLTTLIGWAMRKFVA